MSAPRRNGQLSSCEPCRKSKLRCDHNVPVCNRCASRKLLDSCIYHPSPMSRSQSSKSSSKVESSRNKSIRRSTIESVTIDRSSDAFHRRVSFEESIANRCRHPTRANGYLGPTSYHDILNETDQNSFGPNLQIHTSNRNPSKSNTTYDPSDLELGVQILRLFEYLHFYERIIERRLELSEGWIIGPQFVRKLLMNLKDTYNDTKGRTGSKNSSLLRWSKALFDSAASPTEISKESTLLAYISDISCRWETLGFLFALVGSAAFQITHNDAVFERRDYPGKDIVDLTASMTSACDICLQFCDKLGTMSDSFCWASFQQTVLYSHMYGCRDYRTWRRLGDLVTIVYALGLHQPQSQDSIPFFLAEIRVRTMVGAYALDKELSAFLGRPPLICWEYCNIRYPLDISYDELVAGVDERTIALQKLDVHGWNTDGSTRKGARARTTLLLGILREKVLRFSLCHQGDDIEHNADVLMRECCQIRHDLPPFLQWKETDDPLLDSLHLEFLYQNFMILRTLVKHTGQNLGRLVGISRDILCFLLEMVSKQTRAAKPASSHWDLCHMGLPAAAVLAVELLRFSQNRSQTPQDPSLTSIPWAEIIQKLSVFAWHLDTLGKHHEGDFEVSQTGQTLIKQVLDRVLLSAGMLSTSTPVSADDVFTADGFPNEGLLLDDADFTMWLESMDWEQEQRLVLNW